MLNIIRKMRPLDVVAVVSLLVYGAIILKAVLFAEVMEMDAVSGLSLFSGFAATAYVWFIAGRQRRWDD